MNTPECSTHYVTSIRTHNSQRTEHKYIYKTVYGIQASDP